MKKMTAVASAEDLKGNPLAKWNRFPTTGAFLGVEAALW